MKLKKVNPSSIEGIMSTVHRDGESEGVLVNGRKKIKFALDINAKEILRGINFFNGNGSKYMLGIVSPEDMQFKSPVTLEEFYNEVLVYENIDLCEKSDIYLAARNGLKIETELLAGFVSLGMKPLLCMDKKWRILSLQYDFHNHSVIQGISCNYKIDLKRKFIFRIYPNE